MEQNLNSTKTPARPSHEAIENKIGGSETEERKIDQAAMRGAKRAENRIHADEENLPEDTIFSK